MKRFLTALAALAIALSALLPSAWAVTRTNDFAQTVDTSAKTSDNFDPFNGGQAFGFSVGVTGSFVANWRLQRSLDAGVTWVDYFVFDQSDIVSIPNLAPALWRVTAAGSGDFTSGSATVTFAKGGQASALMRLINKDRTAVSSANPMIVAGVAYNATVNLTRMADTNAYAANDVVGAATGSTAALTFADIGPAAGGAVMITTARFSIDIAAVPSGMTSFRLWVYSTPPPSAFGDNAAWDLPAGDRSVFRGYVDLGTPVDLGSTLYVETVQINKQIIVPAGGALYGYLMTNGGYTPASGSVFKIVLHSMGM